MDQAGIHSQSQIHHPYFSAANTDGGGGDRSFHLITQWSVEETRDLLGIRAELDASFMEMKRNKLLWDAVSELMKEKGYLRSSDQCKCKWKNLVTRYKGCEEMEAEGTTRQQFPFYNDLQAIFSARIQRMLWRLEAEGGGGAATRSSKKRRAAVSAGLSSSDEEDEKEESERERMGSKKKRKGKETGTGSKLAGSKVNSAINGMKAIMEELMKQQMQIETQWLKSYERREMEMREREMEWKRRMEALENERIAMDRRWREREEERKIREEARAEKRDALITLLFNKLTRDQCP